MGRRLHNIVVFLATLLLASAIVPPPPAEAGGFSTSEFGIRRMGMLAVVAKADDVTALFHNPASLVLLEGTEFQFSTSVFLLDLGIRMYDSKGQLRPDHEITPDWTIGVIPFIGVGTDFGTKKLRGAFAIYSPNAFGAMLPENEPSRYHVTQALFLASRGTASLAYEVSDRFSIGGGISLMHVYLMMEKYLNTSMLLSKNYDLRFSDDPDVKKGDILLELNGQDITWAADFGLRFKPLKNLSLGFSFSGGTRIELKGDARFTAADCKSSSYEHETIMPIPFTLRGGLNWELASDFEWGIDVRYWHYQVYQEQRSTFAQEIAELGRDHIVSPKNYMNSWNIATGILHRVNSRLEVMAGLRLDFTPIPTETLTLDNPTQDLIGVTTGVRFKASDSLRLGLALSRGWFGVIDIQDSVTDPPTNIKGHGANTSIGFDLSWKL